VTRKIKQLEVEGTRAQCPIADDANVLVSFFSPQALTFTVFSGYTMHPRPIQPAEKLPEQMNRKCRPRNAMFRLCIKLCPHRRL